jgi:hypothetical protein
MFIFTYLPQFISHSLPGLISHGRTVKKPFALSTAGMLRRFVYRPLNLIPLV